MLDGRTCATLPARTCVSNFANCGCQRSCVNLAQPLAMASPPPASGSTSTPDSVTNPARLATPGTPAVAVPTAAGPHPLQQPLETLLALPADRLRQALHLALAQVREEAPAPAASSVVPALLCSPVVSSTQQTQVSISGFGLFTRPGEGGRRAGGLAEGVAAGGQGSQAGLEL